MTSYHDLEDQTYKSVIAEQVTRIHGKPAWRQKEILKREFTRIAIKHKVSYDWSGGKGLIPLIIGKDRMTEDYPRLPTFKHPDRPPNAPTIAAGATPAEIQSAKDENNILKRDYAVVAGFCRGAGELFQRAVDSEYYEDLEHVSYGYDDVLPIEYFDHLEEEHCPLDERAIKEVRAHYFRGWERSKAPKPEGIRKFGKRLDEEQEALDRDDVKISDADKIDHYLLEVYQSGVFPAATIREWKKKTASTQTWKNAKKFFEAENSGLTEVHRLMGNEAQGNGYESAAAALERGLDTMLDKFNETVEDRIRHAVDEGLQRVAREHPATDAANAANERTIANLADKVDTLTNTIQKLQKELNALKTSGQGTQQSTPSTPSKYTWTDGIKWDNRWPTDKKAWFNKEQKKRDPAKWSEERKKNLERQRKRLAEQEKLLDEDE